MSHLLPTEPEATDLLELLPQSSDPREPASWLDAAVISHEPVGDRYWTLILDAPAIAEAAQPGQFVMLTPSRPGESWPVLPRPMAIYDVDRAGATITIVYGAVGAGTRRLTTFARGETLVAVGPLGRPFDVGTDVGSALLIGRGIGVCSLTMLADRLVARGIPTSLLSSGRHHGAIVGRGLFSRLGVDSHEVYDSNGSSERGAVTAWLRSRYDGEPPALIAVCGSSRLIDLSAELGRRWSCDVQAALEARMACGLGYCHGCSTSRPAATAESPLICRDGPVFRIR